MSLARASLVSAAAGWTLAQSLLDSMPDELTASVQQSLHLQKAGALVDEAAVPETAQSPQSVLKALFKVDVEPVFQGQAPRDLDALAGLLVLRCIQAPLVATVLFLGGTGSGADWDAVYVLLVSNAARALSVDMSSGETHAGADLETNPRAFFSRIGETDQREVAVFQVALPAPAPAKPKVKKSATPTPTPTPEPAPAKKKRAATAAPASEEKEEKKEAKVVDE